MATFRDLNVWEKSMSLVTEVYKLIRKLPKEESYCLSDQMRRAAVSIPSNIAEGHARDSQNVFLRFLSIAQGSRAELDTQLEICVNLGYFSREDILIAEDLSIQVRKMIIVMQKRIRELLQQKTENKVPK